MPNISDDMNRSLVSAYGSGSTADLIRRFWVSQGNPAASTIRDWYLSRGAVGTSFSDVEKDYWSRLGATMPLVDQAVFAIDARSSVVGETVVVNKGTGGAALNATLGSTGGADSNDPLLLAWTGENYLYCPGVAANYASAPNVAGFNIATTLDVTVDFTYSASAVGSILASKDETGLRSWIAWIDPLGRPMLEQYDGTIIIGLARAVNSLVAGVRYVVRFVKANGVAGCDIYVNGVLQSKVSDSTTTASIPNNASAMQVGGNWLGNNSCTASIYRVTVKDNTTTVFDANFTKGITSGAQTTFTESSSNAATVTINRSTAGRKCVAVTRPVWLFGTDDYMEVADNALLNMDATQSFTVLAVVRQWATPTSYGRYVDKKNGGGVGVGWSLSNEVTSITSATFLGDGVAGASTIGTVATAGTLVTAAAVSDRSAQTLKTFANASSSSAVSTSTVGSTLNALPMRVGCAAQAVGSFQDFELLAVAIFRRALTATEIASINIYYGTA